MIGSPAISGARLLGELRRRHVLRIAGVYAVTSWALIEIADTTFPYLQLPPWTTALVLALVIIGFPIAMICAWAFDITPDGVTRTAAVPHARPAAMREHAEAGSQIATIDVREPVRSIAALPFLNLCTEPDTDFLSDGITEEIINALSKIQGLRVAARTSSFSFKHQALDVLEIARRLRVGSVLEGSVRRSGSHLRLTVQLVDAKEGHLLWSHAFDSELKDLLLIQQEVAGRVASVLQLRYQSDAPSSELVSPGSIEAYSLYLKGRHLLSRRTPGAFEQARDCLERSLKLDPAAAPAHASLAEFHALTAEYGLARPADAVPLANMAVEAAVHLAPFRPEVRSARAHARLLDWDLAAAERDYRQVLAISPSCLVARHRLALLLAWTGRFDEALEQIGEALLLDPVSPLVAASHGWILYYARRFDESRRQHRRACLLDPGFANAHLGLGLAEVQAGAAASGAVHIEEALKLSGESPGILPLLSYAYGMAGRMDDARACRARVLRLADSRYISAYYLAVADLGVGAYEAALHRLTCAVEERATQMVYLAVDPVLDPLRAGGIEALLLRVGLPLVIPTDTAPGPE
jgi:TolB-like protein/tetratricopeptide (TPR) repeat protein